MDIKKLTDTDISQLKTYYTLVDQARHEYNVELDLLRKKYADKLLNVILELQ